MEGQVSNNILIAAFVFLLVALLLTLIRLLKGPSVNDRIAAMDLIASLYMGMILIYTLYTGNPLYIDIPMIVSLIAFIGTVAISHYLKQKNE